MSLKISDKSSPNPTTLTTLTLYLRGLKDRNGENYDLSGAKLYAHIKNDLTEADATAEVSINTTDNAAQFVISYAFDGSVDVIFSAANTALTAGTVYYVDVKAVWTDGTVIELVRDTIIFDVPTTLAVT